MQAWREGFTAPAVYWCCLLLLCSAYLQGAIDKLRDFPGAVREMQLAGLAPALPLAVVVIAVEAGGSVLVLSGVHRWLGALLLAGFTLAASLLTSRFWAAPAGAARTGMANTFFEHSGLAGGFLLVAWIDLGGIDGLA